MSDPAPAAAPPEAKRRRKRSVWRRVAIGVLAAIVLLGIAARFGGVAALPSILERVGKGLGLSITFERLDLSLIGGSLELTHLDVARRPAAGTAPTPDDRLVHLDHLGLDWNTWALLIGRVHVRSVVVNGLTAKVARAADGSIGLDGWPPPPAPADVAVARAAEAAPPAPATPPAAAATAPADRDAEIRLSLPIRVDRVRVDDVAVSLRDAAVTPPWSTIVRLDVTVTDVGLSHGPTRVQLFARAPDLIESVALTAQASAEPTAVDADVSLDVTGMHAAVLQRFLEQAGITAAARQISLGFDGKIALHAIDETARAWTGEVKVPRCEVLADLERKVSVATAVTVRSFSRRGAVLDAVEVAVDAAATRLADGGLRACGLELRAPPAAPEPPKPPEPAKPTKTNDEKPAPPPAPVAPAAAPSDSFLLSIGEVRPRLAISLRDEAVTPATDLKVALRETSLKNLTLDPARAHEPIELALALDAADAHLTLAGKVAPLADKKRAELKLALALPHGIVQLAPYVADAPVVSTLDDAKLSFDVTAQFAQKPDGPLELEASLAHLAFTDRGGRDVLFALERLAATGVVVDPAGPIHVGDVRLEKLHTRAFTDEARVLHAVGVVTRGPVLAPAQPPVDLELSNVGLELHGLELGAKPGAPAPAPSTFALTAAVKDLCDELSLRGSLQARPDPLDAKVEAKFAAKGLKTAKVEPFLEGSAIRGELANGAVSLALKAAARRDGAALHAQAELTDFRFGEGEQPLVTLAAVRAPDVTIDEQGIHVGRVVIEQPVVAARRDADGTLHAAGVALPPRAPAPAEPAPVVEAPTPTEPATTPAPTTPAPTSPSPEPPAPPTAAAPAPAAAAAPAKPIDLEELALSGLRVDWNDAAVAPAVATQLTVDAKLAHLVLGGPADPATVALDVGVRDAVTRLHVGGSLSVDPERLGTSLDVAIDGAHAGPLASYLPPNVELATKAGRLRLHFEATYAATEAGGHRGGIEVKDLDWRDGEDGAPFLVLERLALVAPQLDLPRGDIVIDEITTSGLRLRGRRASPELFEALGLNLKLPPPPPPPAPPTPPAAEGATPPAAEATAPAAAPPAPVAPPPAFVPPRRRAALPASLTIKKLDLGIAALDFEGAPVEGVTPPPVHASLRLVGPEPLTLLGPEPEKLPPFKLRVEGSVEPIVHSIAVDLACAPLADTPEIEVGVAVDGVDGTMLPKFAPLLATKIDAHAIEAGTFTAHVHGELNVKRRGPTDLDLRNGFGAEFDVKDLAWRAKPDGPVLAGIEGISVDVKSVRPTTGDVIVRSIEVQKITGSARRTAEGLETCGLVIRTPPPAAEPAPETAASEPSPAAAPAEPQPAPPTDATNAPLPPEIRIDDLLVSGLDFRFVDELPTPPLELPINDLDLDVQHFSTRALMRARPIEFRVAIGAGSLDFPRRDERSLVGGLIGGVVDVVKPGEKKVETEKRPAWDEISVSGQLALHPKPKGWVHLDVSALELQTFKAEAAKSGVEISDGTVDSQVDLRLRDDGVSVDSDTTLSWLSMTEPPNGPISSYLKLPAPLDTVLYLLRDANAQQRLPISFKVEGEKVSSAQVAEVATSALLRLITDAIKGAPMRIVSGTLDAAQLSSLPGVSQLSGLTDFSKVGKLFSKDDTPEYTGNPVVLEFAPGEPTLPPDARAKLEPLFQQMRADDSITLVVENRIGSDDVEQLRRSSLPTPAECGELATRMRLRRNELAARRDAAAAEARARFAIGHPEEAAPLLEDMRVLERERADLEDALDRALELAGRPNERAAERRVRNSCLALADLRVADAHELLLDARVKSMATRFEIKRVRVGVREDGASGCLVVRPKKRK